MWAQKSLLKENFPTTPVLKLTLCLRQEDSSQLEPWQIIFQADYALVGKFTTKCGENPADKFYAIPSTLLPTLNKLR